MVGDGADQGVLRDAHLEPSRSPRRRARRPPASPRMRSESVRVLSLRPEAPRELRDARGLLRQHHRQDWRASPGPRRQRRHRRSDLPAYANGQRLRRTARTTKSSDPDATWGHRSAVCTRQGRGFYGYKIHAAVDARTDLPLAWTVATAGFERTLRSTPDRPAQASVPASGRHHGQGLRPEPVHAGCMDRGVAPVTPLKRNGPVEAR